MSVARLVDTPHFALPLRYVNGSAVVNQQDTMDDIADCVLAVCLTTPGDRDEMPDFGFDDPTFGVQPIPLSPFLAQIANWEPRATILATEAQDKLDSAIVNANLNVVVAG
jgi:phage baseplate assembly protein W